MTTLADFLQGVPLEAICQATTWAFPHMFMRHYALDVHLWQRAYVGKEALNACY